MKISKKFIYSLFSGLLLLTSGHSIAVTLVETAKVEAMINVDNKLYLGAVTSLLDAALSGQLSGRVVEVPQVGDRFKEGDVVITLDSSRYNIQAKAKEAELKKVESELNFFRNRLVNISALSEKKAIAKDSYDELANRVDVLERLQDIAQQDLAEAKWQIEQLKIKAPFDGVIAERNVDQGEYATVGQQLVRLVNIERQEISVAIPGKIAKELQLGSSVTIEDGSDKFTGQIRTVILVSDRADKVDVRIKTDKAELVIGRNVRVGLHLPQIQGQLVSVPRDALIFKESGTFIAKVDSDNKARLLSVKISGNFGEQLNVAGDLIQGEQVIVRGGDLLADGSDVITQAGVSL